MGKQIWIVLLNLIRVERLKPARNEFKTVTTLIQGAISCTWALSTACCCQRRPTARCPGSSWPGSGIAAALVVKRHHYRLATRKHLERFNRHLKVKISRLCLKRWHRSVVAAILQVQFNVIALCNLALEILSSIPNSLVCISEQTKNKFWVEGSI